ncbi:MAG: trypsin-like serine protease [Planctomycetes bacterium]|nr:trypsin-like serine protease [Planctomycetota bacterium]
MNPRILHSMILGVFWPLGLTAAALAQPAFTPYHRQVYEINSGLHDGRPTETVSAFRQEVRVPRATWLRLNFADYDLGERSYLIVTSLEDGDWQRLDATGLSHWQGSSGFFNGDAVEIELHVASVDRGIFFRVKAVSFGRRDSEAGDGEPSQRELCDPNHLVDNRNYIGPIGDLREGRLIFGTSPNQIARCTTWLVSNGALLTAGHCAPFGTAGNPAAVEFAVPLSNANGSTNFASLNDQYPVDPATIQSRTDGTGVGDDWAVFGCFPNTNTNLLPVHAQGEFFRMTRDSSPLTVRVTGYGIDNIPAGTGGTTDCAAHSNCNTNNRTLQTDSGPFENEDVQGDSDVVIEYSVDTEAGNSGSPVYLFASTRTDELALGIHTNSGCPNGQNQGNAGTGFENDDLENAIQTFPGSNVVYADSDHAIGYASSDGTVFRPFFTVKEAVKEASSGAIISIVKGSYTAAAGNTFTVGADGKRMTFDAPVGSVVIGN